MLASIIDSITCQRSGKITKIKKILRKIFVDCAMSACLPMYSQQSDVRAVNRHNDPCIER